MPSWPWSLPASQRTRRRARARRPPRGDAGEGTRRAGTRRSDQPPEAPRAGCVQDHGQAPASGRQARDCVVSRTQRPGLGETLRHGAGVRQAHGRRPRAPAQGECRGKTMVGIRPFKEKTMWCNAVGCIVTLTLSLLAAPLAAHGQPAGKLPRIGVLAAGPPPGEPGRGAQRFRQALRDLGYVEGQTMALEIRWAENQPERYPDLAADLVRLPVDIIVAGDTAAALAAKHAT